MYGEAPGLTVGCVSPPPAVGDLTQTLPSRGRRSRGKGCFLARVASSTARASVSGGLSVAEGSVGRLHMH